ncbi:MAG: alpha/beta hydrolase [Clostridiaceae bacterium]|nr:alpha/beta hydrolase [Clostridiaceae bacterium]
MNKNYNVDSLYRNEKKIKPLVVFTVILLIIIIFSVIFLFSKVYRVANTLTNRAPEPFADVVENAMPTYTSTSFFSLDKSLMLEGWFFKRNTSAFRGNIIFVHNNRDNRVQFGLETSELFSTFINEGFNVLAFDLRNSGRSDGEMSTYGYAEYKDVISAMQHMYNFTGEKEFIIYGVGSGTSATLIAWNELETSSKVDADSYKIENTDLAVFKEDVIGMILDTPVSTPDDYIRADIPNNTFLDRTIVSKFAPATIKATAGYTDDSNLIPLISQFNQPVLITRNIPNTRIESESIDTIIDERLRLHPGTTTVFETAEAGHIDGYLLEQENYLRQLTKFLDIWFPNLYPEETLE